MKDENVDRRSFLNQAGKLAALGGFVVVAGLPSGCGRDPDGSDLETGNGQNGRTGDAQTSGAANADGTTATNETGTPGQSQPQTPTTETGDPCGDLSGLTEEDLSDRADISYVASTPDPKKRCDNCELWIPPENGSPCGGCDVLAGPIHPKGHCDVWVPA